MKVLYLITNNSHGRGGHFYSIKETSVQMAKNVEVAVLVVGNEQSSVLKGLDIDVRFEKYTGMLRTLWRVLRVIREITPDRIHAFDTQSYFFSRLASILLRIPIVLTKCGGPNPEKYYPFSRSLVVYSKENAEYFANRKKYSRTKTYLIPNRVSAPKQDQVRINELKAILQLTDPVFLRISRISNNYKHSILQAFNLVKKLNAQGIRVRLLIIGAVQDRKALEEITYHLDENISIITQDRYTINSSELVDIADFVVGTGRGFMEAALLSKVMLAPNANSYIPVLVTKENIDVIARLNFSGRYETTRSEDELYESVKILVDRKANRQKIAQLTQRYSDEHFNADQIFNRHIAVYREARIASFDAFDLLLHAYLTWKTYSHAQR